MRSRHLYLTPWLLGCLIGGPAVAQDSNALKAQTVMITVTRADQPAEHGSGVVLCQDDETVYVLTAHHVLAGKSKQPSGKNPLRLKRIEEAEISFFGNSPPPVGKDALTVYQVAKEDLLLLSFPMEQKLAPTPLAAPAVVDEEAAEDDRPAVVAVGYWKDQAQTWVDRTGTLLPGGGRLLHHSADIAEGFSGGPLFNEAGALVGINIERVAGAAIGAEPGSWFGEALVVEQMLPAIDKWVPAKCLRSDAELSDLAHLTYRRAMQAVSTRRWQRAEELMRQAIEQQSVAGGSVHLEGMRYTTYLPHYHRGLALYKLGNFGEAIRELERSEAQGEIRQNRRYSTLKRLKARSYDALRRQSREAASSPQGR